MGFFRKRKELQPLPEGSVCTKCGKDLTGSTEYGYHNEKLYCEECLLPMQYYEYYAYASAGQTDEDIKDYFGIPEE